MRSIFCVVALLACLSFAPLAAQEEPRSPGLVERAKKGFQQILDLLLQDYGSYFDEVDRAMESRELVTGGESVVIELNARLTTLKADDSTDRNAAADTPVHEVNHLVNSEKFLDDAATEAMQTLLYLKAVGLETAVLRKYAEDAPKKAEALLDDLEWADSELRGMVERLSGSPTSQDLEREKRLLAQIKTTLGNVSRVVASEVERGEDWLDEVEKADGTRAEGLEKIRRYRAEKVEGKATAKLLPAVVERVRTATQTWLKSGEAAIKANADARKEAEEALETLTKATLLDNLESFKGKLFADLVGTAEEKEKFLKAVESRLEDR